MGVGAKVYVQKDYYRERLEGYNQIRCQIVSLCYEEIKISQQFFVGIIAAIVWSLAATARAKASLAALTVSSSQAKSSS